MALQDSYTLPLNSQGTEQGVRTLQGVTTNQRPRFLRLRILGTNSPSAKFVHMNSLQFRTTTGRLVNSEFYTISNSGAVRQTPKEGPDALKMAGARRWTDYSSIPAPIMVEFHGGMPEDHLM